jgi:hypothetical protein
MGANDTTWPIVGLVGRRGERGGTVGLGATFADLGLVGAVGGPPALLEDLGLVFDEDDSFVVGSAGTFGFGFRIREDLDRVLFAAWRADLRVVGVGLEDDRGRTLPCANGRTLLLESESEEFLKGEAPTAAELECEEPVLPRLGEAGRAHFTVFLTGTLLSTGGQLVF